MGTSMVKSGGGIPVSWVYVKTLVCGIGGMAAVSL
jgi:hypothetical protein